MSYYPAAASHYSQHQPIVYTPSHQSHHVPYASTSGYYEQPVVYGPQSGGYQPTPVIVVHTFFTVHSTCSTCLDYK